MTSPFIDMVAAFARRTGARLAPDWASELPNDLQQQDREALNILAQAAGWAPPKIITTKPKAQQFPLLIFSDETGWGIADQWTSETEIRVLTVDSVQSLVWTKGLLLAAPIFPQNAEANAEPKALRIFVRALLGRKRLMVEATIATVILNLVALGTSFYTMQVYDRVIPLSGFATLWVLTGGMVIAMMIDFLIRTSRSFLVDREAGEIDMQTSEFFFSRMQSVRMDARPPGIGTMAAQLRGLDQIRSTMTSASFFCLADLPFALMFILVMMMLGGPIALVPLMMFPAALIAAFIFAMLIRAATNKAQISGNRKNGILVEALDASETIKANLGSWHMLAGWNRLVEDVHEHDQIVRRWSNVASATFTVMQQVSYVGVVLAGVYLVTSGNMTQGGLVACTIIGGRVNGPLVSALPNLIVQWGYARSSLKALDSLLAMPSDHEPGKTPVRMSLPAPELRAEGLTFTHRGAREGLDIPTLTIAAGSRLGLIGPIGSGKSTLLRLLAGLYAPEAGHVLLNGVDIRQIAEDDLRRACCYIAQDYRLISGTLRDNVVMGLPDPGDEAIMAAAAETGLAQVIQDHPSGLDLPISEGGGGLSGGQRTLVGLTRAILAKPRMLLLDEPTANLDAETEARVLSALLAHMPEDGMVLLVTHKLQLLSLVKTVILLKNGKIAHEGPSRSVLETLRPRAAAEPQAEVARSSISPKMPSAKTARSIMPQKAS